MKIKIPIKKGKKVGILTIYEDNKEMDKIDVTIKQDLKKANIITLYGRYLKSILNGNINI